MAIPSPPGWSVWRLRDEWPRSLVPAALAVGLAALGGGWALGLTGAIVFAFLMAASFATYFLPVSYRLEGRDLLIRFLGVEATRPLASFRRLDLHPGGAFISPQRRPSAAGRLRGFWVHLPRDEALREALVAALRGGLS